MNKAYLLDTSAIFAYMEDEAGAQIVENILNGARHGKNKILISFITLTEIYYIVWQEKGEDFAREAVVLLKSLPVEFVESSERLNLSAGRIKANHKLSLADAFVAAAALDRSATLVHKDPEFEALAGFITLMALPYKA